jgi:hypothetical protein
MHPPISHIKIKASPTVHPFLDLFRDMGVTQDDKIKTLQEFLVGKRPEGRRRIGRKASMDYLITHVIQFLGHAASEGRIHQVHEAIGDRILENSSQGSILPLSRVRQITMSQIDPLAPKPFIRFSRMNLYLYLKVFLEKGFQPEVMIPLHIGHADTPFGETL